MMPEWFIFLSLCLTSELCYSKHTRNVPQSITFFNVLFEEIRSFHSTAVVILFYTYDAFGFALVACEKFRFYKMATFYNNSPNVHGEYTTNKIIVLFKEKYEDSSCFKLCYHQLAIEE